MSDPYAHQYPPPMMHDPSQHQQNMQSAYGQQQQPDAVYYPQAGPENYQQSHGVRGGGQLPHPNDYYVPSGSDQEYRNHPYQQQQQQHVNYFPNHDQYYEEPEYAVTSPKTPMVQQQQQPYHGPTLAPVNEAEGYRPKPQQVQHDENGCCYCCCCYNPAMTCCSCFCMLISIGFLAAGIGLIVASSVIQGKCDEKCGEIPEEYRSQTACGTICGKVVHDALYYSGIGVTALAGLGVIWRLFAWTCAGCSKH
ncbi:hypothetical protein BX666DRAFT_2115229 [Dichotomocladium elegans]|nr:hypothetical protein BX666DRAFT_2115229 [Dichotomocladium elegans]